MKKVLLTGATGFIGSNAIIPLERFGYKILAPTSSELNLLCEAQVTEYLSKNKPTHLLHFAWDVTPGKYLNSNNNEDWYKSSVFLLKEFEENGGQRAVLAGTLFEKFYDNAYATAKKMLLEDLTQLGLSYAWGRIYYLFGENEKPQRLVPVIIRTIIEGEKVKCTSGEQVKDYMYVKDAAGAFVSLLDSNVEGIVDIGSGEGIKLRDFILKIAEKLNGQNLVEFGALPDPQNEIYFAVADIKRLKEEVGFNPKFTLDEAITRIVDSILFSGLNQTSRNNSEISFNALSPLKKL